MKNFLIWTDEIAFKAWHSFTNSSMNRKLQIDLLLVVYLEKKQKVGFAK